MRVGLARMSVQDRVSFGLDHPWMVTAWPGVSGIFILVMFRLCGEGCVNMNKVICEKI